MYDTISKGKRILVINHKISLFSPFGLKQYYRHMTILLCGIIMYEVEKRKDQK